MKKVMKRQIWLFGNPRMRGGSPWRSTWREAGPRGQEIEFQGVLADRSGLEVVLAVDVHGEAAGESREHGARHHRRPPAVLDRPPPEPLDGQPRLGLDDPCLRVPAEHPVELAEVEDQAAAVEGRVAVA